MLEQYYEYQNMLQRSTNENSSNMNEPQSKWILRMEFDADLMLDKNITMDDIHFAIVNSHGDKLSCIYSDFNEDKLIFRIRVNSFIGDSARKKQKEVEGLDVNDHIHYLKNIQDNLLKKIVLRGIDGISKVIPRKLQNMVVKEEGKFSQKDTWILDTTGSNLLEVLGLPYIDGKRTYSNDIYEVFDVLGIEAARQVILNELNEVMEFNSVYINYHHLSVLADRMTYAKDMVAVYRSGILNDDIGPIAKATFEMHTEMLLNAAKHGHLDNMRGVSANVMCGQQGFFGTNAFQVHIDLKEMEKNTIEAELSESHTTSVYNVTKNIEDMFNAVITPEKQMDKCSAENIKISNYLSGMPTVEETKPCLSDNYDMGF
jgi:DNA-directed RNA polymerase II subunit RPB1